MAFPGGLVVRARDFHAIDRGFESASQLNLFHFFGVLGPLFVSYLYIPAHQNKNLRISAWWEGVYWGFLQVSVCALCIGFNTTGSCSWKLFFGCGKFVL